uniref:Putative gtp-binding protein n=1 Tax=Ornithodoros turicata TaxID=34597 RepID=A0A2R5LJC2_9ACAR
MREEELEVALKVVVVGNGGVGKSSLIQRYCKGVFTAEYKKTIGVDFLERELFLRGQDVRLMLWDTAGQEEFDALTKAYYRGAQACVLAFSATDRASFRALESWRRKFEAECGPLPMVIVHNKVDLIKEAVVSREEVDEMARRMQLRCFRTSVKENINVDEVFQYLAERCLDQMQHTVDSRESHPTATVSLTRNGPMRGISLHHKPRSRWQCRLN